MADVGLAAGLASTSPSGLALGPSAGEWTTACTSTVTPAFGFLPFLGASTGNGLPSSAAFAFGFLVIHFFGAIAGSLAVHWAGSLAVHWAGSLAVHWTVS